MEQQTVTIAKAGIHASLNARCSVACAANPVYGQYDRTRRPQENIGLPDSLLSRFDLLFIVLDQLDPVMDRQLAEHVIRSHQYRRPGATMEPEPLNQHASLHLEDPVEDPKDTDVWQKGGKLVGGDNGNTKDILSKDFLMKYVHYAKTRMHPVLTEDAMESISIAYADMRGKQTPKNLPVTARTLETIIRLSTAHAKCRLSVNVEEEDVEAALELMNFVMFHEVGDFTSQTIQRSDGPPSQQFAVPKRPRKQDEEDSTSNDDDDDDDSVLRKKRAMNLQDSRFEGDGVPIPVDRSLSKYRRVGEVIDKIRATTGYIYKK
jgi:DNA replication licensing factor MCM3